jgi:caffeoyl-CoA O-methyltransferase
VIVPDEIDGYAESHTTAPEPLLVELAAETRATMSSPQMLTGTVEGRFLEQLVFALQAKRVLELGTFTGYSSIAMASALTDDGRITIHMGPALDTIERLGGEWDFVFVDADKENYANYYEALVPRLKATGLMAIDNTLWSGRVIDDEDDSAQTRAIRELNDRIAADDRVVAVQLTVRDGVTLVRRR